MSQADDGTRGATSAAKPIRLVTWGLERTGWFLAAYWTALFIGTHIPLPFLKETPKFSDKLLHFGAYGGLAFLIGLWAARTRGLSWRVKGGVLLIVAIYGIADELLQIPVNRSAEVADWVADVLGGMAGIAVLYAIQYRVRQWQQNLSNVS